MMATSFFFPRGRRGRAVEQPSFPTQQLLVLALCRICEPIAFMSIFPYSYHMVRSFHITIDDDKIAFYVGMVTSAFAFAEFSAGVVWGRLSDKIGRKPVLIGGLAGTALSMIIFGFSRTLPMALAARALGGVLNGNIGVLQTTVAELVSVKEHQPRAYSIMPFVWCLGSIIGPALGGALARPALSWPETFPEDSLFSRFPFLLPNLICTIVLVCGVIIGILFLEETHEELKHRRDLGLDVGRLVLRQLTRRARNCRHEVPLDKAGDACLEETSSLIEDQDPPPGYRTSEGSPSTSRTHSPVKDERSRKPCAAKKAFTKQVVMNIVAYGILAYHTISFDQLVPVFLSEPVSYKSPSLPFKFVGGFGMSEKTIGTLLAIQGAYSVAAQLILFPFIVKKLGTLRLFRLTVILWPALYVLMPYTVLLPPHLKIAGVMFCLLWRITAQVLAFPANAILLTNSAPSAMVLGLVNGVAASTASLSRAIGPTTSGLIHSAGLQMGYTGFAWWIGSIFAAIGAFESFLIHEDKGRLDVDAEEDDLDLECTGNDSGHFNPTAFEAALDVVSRPAKPAILT